MLHPNRVWLGYYLLKAFEMFTSGFHLMGEGVTVHIT